MDSKNSKIFILYSGLVGYVFNIINEVIKNYDANYYVVRWDKNNLSAFQFENLNENIKIYNKSEINLIETIKEVNPDIIFISGWMDRDYLNAIKFFKGKIPIVCMSDTKWLGGWRQLIKATPFFKYFLNLHFDEYWVAGPRQYTFIRRLGIKDEKIHMNLYSADTPFFNNIYQKNLVKKNNNFPKTFFYVGRLSKEKGIDLLLKAFYKLSDEVNHGWKLVLIGNGDLEINNKYNVELWGFMTKEQLAGVAEKGGVFCMPSYREQWGVAIHEFAALGFPLLLADVCGSIPFYLIEGYNGYTFKTAHVESLKDKLLMMTQLTDEKLNEFGKNSVTLSTRVSPEISAATVAEIYNKLCFPKVMI